MRPGAVSDVLKERQTTVKQEETTKTVEAAATVVPPVEGVGEEECENGLLETEGRNTANFEISVCQFILKFFNFSKR